MAADRSPRSGLFATSLYTRAEQAWTSLTVPRRTPADHQEPPVTAVLPAVPSRLRGLPLEEGDRQSASRCLYSRSSSASRSRLASVRSVAEESFASRS